LDRWHLLRESHATPVVSSDVWMDLTILRLRSIDNACQRTRLPLGESRATQSKVGLPTFGKPPLRESACCESATRAAALSQYLAANRSSTQTGVAPHLIRRNRRQ